jgi:RNA polymerase sigma-70 factor (ECF subfamily)
MAENIFRSPDPEQKQLAQWLAACARKDAKAFRALYDACSPKLFGFALRILIKREWAEEVLQESFVNIWNNAAAFQAGLALPMTWMTTIVRNKAFDMLRKQRQDGANIELDADNFQDGGMGTILDTLESEDATPQQAMEMRDDARALAHCFGQLQGMQRQAIALSFYHDLSHSEVAEQLTLPMGTVKTWIRRGLERLKTCMSKMELA